MSDKHFWTHIKIKLDSYFRTGIETKITQFIQSAVLRDIAQADKGSKSVKYEENEFYLWLLITPCKFVVFVISGGKEKYLTNWAWLKCIVKSVVVKDKN